MIVTPEHIIKKYFPNPVETTRELYDRLGLIEYGYLYSNWLKDLEQHCLSKYIDESEYKLLSDDEKNYWISEKAFRTILETSPSKIGDEIRTCFTYISKKIATDPTFARQLQDQIDQESGIEKVVPKVSKALKTNYNTSGQDAFAFSVEADKRLHLDIISGYNFQPGLKVKDAAFSFKLVTESGIPYHVIDMVLSLTNDHTLSYRTVWCCSEERQRYGSILMKKMVRINLFGDNKKLVDSFDYVWGLSQLKTLELELEEAISMLLEIDLDGINLDQMGEKILHRYNLNDKAYVQAIKSAIPTMAEYAAKANAEMVDAAFHDAVHKYWEYYVLQPDPTRDFIDDLEQMIKDRIPRITLVLTVGNMLNYGDLCEKYFKHKFSDNQKDALLIDGNLRLIYALAEATEFDPGADHKERINNMCAFITKHLDVMKQMLVDTGQWPKR